MRVFWLSSYPKSGNTWLRFLLYGYFFGVPGGSADVARRIPDLHVARQLMKAEPFDVGGKRTIFIKSHHMFTPWHPMRAETAGAIHVVRHPRDVLLSNLHYARLVDDNDVNPLSDEQYARAFIRFGGDPRWIRYGMGTWLDHLAAWTQNSSVPALRLRYEDLKARPDAELRKVLAFLNLRPNEDRLKVAVEVGSFERMRSLETREKHEKKPTIFSGSQSRMRQGMLFLHKARSNQSLAHLAPDLDELLERRFGPALDSLGYSRSSAPGVGVA